MPTATRSRPARTSTQSRPHIRRAPTKRGDVLLSDDDRARYDDPIQDALATLPALYAKERARGTRYPVERALATLPVLSLDDGLPRSEYIRDILQAIAQDEVDVRDLAVMVRGWAAEERRLGEIQRQRVKEEDGQLAAQSRDAIQERTRLVSK